MQHNNNAQTHPSNQYNQFHLRNHSEPQTQVSFAVYHIHMQRFHLMPEVSAKEIGEYQ